MSEPRKVDFKPRWPVTLSPEEEEEVANFAGDRVVPLDGFKNLDEYLKAHPTMPKDYVFKPFFRLNQYGWLEVYWKDVPCYAAHVSHDIILMRSLDRLVEGVGEVVGVKIRGVKEVDHSTT